MVLQDLLGDVPEILVRQGPEQELPAARVCSGEKRGDLDVVPSGGFEEVLPLWRARMDGPGEVCLPSRVPLRPDPGPLGFQGAAEQSWSRAPVCWGMEVEIGPRDIVRSGRSEVEHELAISQISFGGEIVF